MATYYTQKSRGFGPRIGQGHARQEIVAEAIVEITTAMIDNVNDEVGLFYLPKGAVITGATISATDMDTNASPTLAFDVGDDSSESRIFAASQVGRAGTLSTAMERGAHLYKYTSATLVKAYVQAAAATGAAGTLYVSVRYFVDADYSTTALTASTTA